MLPDSALQAEAGRFNFLFLIGLLGFLIILLLLVLVFLRRYSRQTEAMLYQKKYSEASEEELVVLTNEGESSELEFKSTLRWNLKTNKPDKNIELATMKTVVAFLNSDGGTLLVGVKDDGEISGIENDNFTNEDKLLLHFNNLIKQHIGLEFAQHIYFAIKTVGEKGILVVDCEESEDPAFLKHDGGEDFYVRIGPGSRKLPTSKVLDYLKNQDNS
jgi:predicted HTH transcriptional regulator